MPANEQRVTTGRNLEQRVTTARTLEQRVTTAPTFYLFPQAAERLAGQLPDRKKWLQDRQESGFFVGLIMAVLFFVCLFGPAVQGGAPVSVWYAAAFFAFLASGLLSGLVRCIRKGQRRARRYAQGQFLPGSIVRCWGRDSYSQPTHPDGLAEIDGYVVTVEFCFRAPSGREVHGVEGGSRDDLRGKPLPAPGTPVIVFHLPDDDCEIV